MRKSIAAGVAVVMMGLVGLSARAAGENEPAGANPPAQVTSRGDTTAAAPVKVYDPRCPRCTAKSRPRLGGAGGPVPGYLFADLDVINAQVRKMGIPKVPETIFMMGGKGYARFGNIILGGGGCGGSSETSGMPDESARYATVDFAYGGGIIGVDLAHCRYELTAGLLVGAGSVAVTRRLASRGVFAWEDAWDTFGADLPDSVAAGDLTVSSRLAADFLAIEPFLELRIRLASYMALGLSGSYLRAHVAKGAWKMDGLEIIDSPEANLGGPSARLGVIFGR